MKTFNQYINEARLEKLGGVRNRLSELKKYDFLGKFEKEGVNQKTDENGETNTVNYAIFSKTIGEFDMYIVVMHVASHLDNWGETYPYKFYIKLLHGGRPTIPFNAIHKNVLKYVYAKTNEERGIVAVRGGKMAFNNLLKKLKEELSCYGKID